jgi:KDO2-lipid IV(A) lauroyltransferase
VVDDNLRHAFPNLDAPSRTQIALASFRHFVSLLIEVARLPRKMHRSNVRDCADMTAAAPLWDALTSGRPVMLITGHLGNWEIALYGLGLLGFPIHAVARPLDNPFVDRFVRRFRERTGQTLLSKKGDVERIMAVLEAGGTVATLADQDAGPRGLFVEYFGRPASTHKPIALLAMKFHALIVVCGVIKNGDAMRYRVIAEDVIDAADFAGRTDAARAITQRYTAALERLVRQAPEQYFWMHRRWKHQPATSAKRAA